MNDVTAIGELLIDFSTVGLNENGYPRMQANAGGAPCNYLAALAKYGARTAFIGKVGSDAFGRMLRGTLEEAGVDTRGLVRTEESFTTLAFVTLDANGERSFSFARKPGADTQLRYEEIDLRLVDESTVLHFGSLSLTDEPARSATKRLVAYARDRGKLISYDPNYREPLWPDEASAREEILWGLRQADVVKISEEELAFLFQCQAEEGAALLIDEYGASLVMVTMGSRGCLIQNRRAACHVPAPAVKPVDTTGAGDIFGGSAMKKLLEIGEAPSALDVHALAEVALFASCAASLSTEHPGGIPSIPARRDVEACAALLRQQLD